MAWFLSRCGKQNGLTGASKILVYLEKARKERVRENDPNIFSFLFFYLRFFQRLSFFRWSFFSSVLICASVLPVMDFLGPSLPKSRYGTTIRKVSEMCSACRKGALHVWGTLKHKFNVVGGTRRHPIYVANLARLATYGTLILFIILESFPGLHTSGKGVQSRPSGRNERLAPRPSTRPSFSHSLQSGRTARWVTNKHKRVPPSRTNEARSRCEAATTR